MIKNPPNDAGVQSLVGKIPWRKKIVTHSSILTYRVPGTEEVGYSLWSHKELDTAEPLSLMGLSKCNRVIS